MSGYTGMPAADLNIHSSKPRVTGWSSITVTAGQALCHALHFPAPKHLRCCCGSSPFCYPGKKQGSFSASLLQQRGGREAEGWSGFLFLVGKAPVPQQSAVLLFMGTVEGVCEMVGTVMGKGMHYPVVAGRGRRPQEGEGCIWLGYSFLLQSFV